MQWQHSPSMAKLVYYCDECAYTEHLRIAVEEAARNDETVMLLWVVAYVKKRESVPHEISDGFLITLLKAVKKIDGGYWCGDGSTCIANAERWRLLDYDGKWQKISHIGTTFKGQPFRIDGSHDWRKFWRVFEPIYRMPRSTDPCFWSTNHEIFSTKRIDFTNPKNYQYLLDTFMTRQDYGTEAIGYSVYKAMGTPKAAVVQLRSHESDQSKHTNEQEIVQQHDLLSEMPCGVPLQAQLCAN